MRWIATREDFRKYVKTMINAEDTSTDKHRVSNAIKLLHNKRVVTVKDNEIHFVFEELHREIDSILNSVLP